MYPVQNFLKNLATVPVAELKTMVTLSWFKTNGEKDELVEKVRLSIAVIKVDPKICLWVNKKYPHLGASPDGLIYDSQENLLGIIEVKCLKALIKR